MKNCQHTRQEIRSRVASNGRHMYAYQCMICGLKVGDWIPHSQIDPESSVLPFDDDLQDEARQQAMTERRVAYEQSRDVERDKFNQWYRGYLLTPAWRMKRRLVLNRCNNLCEGCANAKATVVHHLTYDHVGDELLFELVGLCEGCHDKAHKRPRTAAAVHDGIQGS